MLLRIEVKTIDHDEQSRVEYPENYIILDWRGDNPCLMKIRHYNLFADIRKRYKIALVADFHDHPYESVLDSLSKEKPDFITANGDVLYAAVSNHGIFEHVPESSQHFRFTQHAQNFLEDAVQIAPVLFSTGNHELYLDENDENFLKETGITFLDDSFYIIGELVFGGLSSSYKYLANAGMASTKGEHRLRWDIVFSRVNTSWLDEYERQEGYKILLSHHPEFYDRYLRNRKIDLILSGHAHGGQVRLLGHGLFAYGQGLFPKYTDGFIDGKMIVSRGLSNTSRIPRIGNPTELVYVNLNPITSHNC